jgi:hypothetical protein
VDTGWKGYNPIVKTGFLHVSNAKAQFEVGFKYHP